MTLNRSVAAALLIAPLAACGGATADRTVNEGTWQTTAGSPTDAEAVVVELVPAPYEFHRYQRVGKDILLILDAGDRPLIGNAQHSFTLSRTQ